MSGPPARVDNLQIWRQKQQIDASGTQLREIRLKRTWIGRKILAGPELQRVNIDAGDHDIGVITRTLHQIQVSGVQIAHRRHKSNTPAVHTQVRYLTSHVSCGYGDFHGFS